MKPLRDLVLIQLDDKEEQTASGLFITKAWEDSINKGTVLECGEHVIDVTKGDKVMFNPYATIPGMEENTRFVREQDILSVG